MTGEAVHDTIEVHDQETLGRARALLDACTSPEQMQDAVIAAVRRNEAWRGRECINLETAGILRQSRISTHDTG